MYYRRGKESQKLITKAKYSRNGQTASESPFRHVRKVKLRVHAEPTVLLLFECMNEWFKTNSAIELRFIKLLAFV